MNKDQYLAYRLVNDFLGIAYQYYLEKVKEKGITGILGEDFFRTTFSIWPFSEMVVEEILPYYDAKFNLTFLLDKEGKIIKVT